MKRKKIAPINKMLNYMITKPLYNSRRVLSAVDSEKEPCFYPFILFRKCIKILLEDHYQGS